MASQDTLKRLERVREVASLAGLKCRIDEERGQVEMGFRLDQQRSQLVYIRDTSNDKRQAVTIFSPCLIVSKGLIAGLSKETAIQLLRQNEQISFARYGIWESDTQTMVVASYDHLLDTLDPQELESTAWSVAIAADMFEREHGQDKF